MNTIKQGQLDKLVSSAVEEAYRRGAEQMRERAAKLVDDMTDKGPGSIIDLIKAIRAMPVE